MSISTNETPIVAIAQKRSFEINGHFAERHAPLARRLDDYGVGAVALNGAVDHAGDGIFARHYTFDADDRNLTLSDSPIRVDSALDITGGIARYTPEVAALNPLGVREIALSKQLQFEALRGELGDAIPMTVIASASSEAVNAAIDSLQTDQIILKAEGDYEKAHRMLVGSKDEVRPLIGHLLKDMNPNEDKVLAQEFMPEAKEPFATGIRYFDDNEAAIDQARSGTSRELRVHVIDDTPILVTGRAGLDAAQKSPRDEWIYLDGDSVPSHVYDLASEAARLIRLRADAIDSYLAVDMTPDGRRIVEVNGRNIGTMRSEVGRPGSLVAHEITTDAVARKLVVMAHNKRGA